MNNSLSYFPAIDGMRALAVLAVIFYHLELPIISGGFVGVDVFFVISGYLITRNILAELRSKNFSFIRFYLSRLRRLTPALLVTIAVTLVFGFLLYPPDALIRLTASAISGVTSLANIRFWLSADYFDSYASSKPLLHLWSLSLEEQFYFIWPLLLYIVFKITKREHHLLLVISFTFLISLYFSQHFVLKQPSTAFYWVQFRAYEFAIGAWLVSFESIVSVKKNSSKNLMLELTCIIGLTIFIYAITTFDHSTLFPGYSALIPCLATALLIYSKKSMTAKFLLANSIARGIGKISYSLYLVHWPIWVYASFWHFATFTLLQKTLLFLCMLFMGSFLHYFVENRFRRSNLSTSNSQKLFFSILILLALLILLAAWYVRINQGLPNRIEQYGHTNQYSQYPCAYPNDDKRQQECKLGAQEATDIKALLIGDSHSMNMRSTLHRLAENNNFSIDSISYAGCPPLMDVELYYHKLSAPDQTCKSFSKRLNGLFENKDYDTVIIVARWMWYYEHEHYHVTMTPKKAYLFDKDRRMLTADSSRLVWENAIERTVMKAKKFNKKLILFSQPPLLNQDIGECDKYPLYLIDDSKKENRCIVKIPYENILKRNSFTDQLLAKHASNMVLIIKPSEFICDNVSKKCDVFNDEGLLYTDADHLSVLGAHHIIESMQQKIIDFINK